MPPLRIECDGIQVGSLWVPPFDLVAGQLLCLHLPVPHWSPDQEMLVEFLISGQAVPGLRRHGRVVHAAGPTSTRAGLLGGFRQLRPDEWLRREAGISRPGAEAIVQRLQLPPTTLLCRLAGNPRLLLALEAAWARGAEAVVFTTAGCDPLGVRAAYAAVESHLKECAAIHYSARFTNGSRDCWAGATCLEISRVADARGPDSVGAQKKAIE